MPVKKKDGLIVGDLTPSREDYVKALKLPAEAGWGHICREQNRRYFATKPDHEGPR